MTVGVNVVVLAGEVAAEPVARTLPDGSEVVELRVSVPAVEGRRELPLPVAIWSGVPGYDVARAGAYGPGGSEPAVPLKGSAVLIHGRLSRRFYRSGAGARSLTEVVASGLKVLSPESSETETETADVG